MGTTKEEKKFFCWLACPERGEKRDSVLGKCRILTEEKTQNIRSFSGSLVIDIYTMQANVLRSERLFWETHNLNLTQVYFLILYFKQRPMIKQLCCNIIALAPQLPFQRYEQRLQNWAAAAIVLLFFPPLCMVIKRVTTENPFYSLSLAHRANDINPPRFL